ncbi:MAG: lasso RiPP family leader peptide-containing protein [Candidatus Binataceae bacterium]|jgi:hypothetical protein
MSVRKSEPGTQTVTQHQAPQGQARLPYNTPKVADYGSVAALTQKAGSLADGSHGSRGCDPHRGGW